jgi:hypothetical protein
LKIIEAWVYLSWAVFKIVKPIMSGVGLANATNSNTDTTARVHTTARVCINLYNSLADPTLVKRNPNEFKAIKEEIALGLARPFAALGMSYAEQRGLAPVFTNTSVINGGQQDDLMHQMTDLIRPSRCCTPTASRRRQTPSRLRTIYSTTQP